jgi:hypothetical protein
MEKFSFSGIILAAFIISWGFIVVLNDYGVLDFQFPFWPAVIIIISVAILLQEFGSIKEKKD